MEQIIFGNFILFTIIGSIWAAIGLDLKKWSSWLLGLYAFISGFLVSFLRNDGAGGYKVVVNLAGSLQVAALLTFAVMFVGATSRWNRNMAKKYLARAEEDYQEKLENLSKSLFKGKLNKK